MGFISRKEITKRGGENRYQKAANTMKLKKKIKSLASDYFYDFLIEFYNLLVTAKMSVKKKLLLFILVLLSVAVLSIGFLLFNAQKDLQAMLNEGVLDFDLRELSPGAYQGSFALFPVSAKVEVHLRDNAIENIELLDHFHGRGYNGEAIIDEIMKEQSLNVDMISGATHSSFVILKAVENALLQQK